MGVLHPIWTIRGVRLKMNFLENTTDDAFDDDTFWRLNARQHQISLGRVTEAFTPASISKSQNVIMGKGLYVGIINECKS